MAEPPSDVVAAELALELLEGELAAELPAHMRAFARAHADGRAPPAAPTVVRLASTLQTVRGAWIHDELGDRALSLLRLLAPIVIEDDPAVAAARRAEPSWDGLAALAAARDAVATRRFGMRAIELLHRLHGCAGVGEAAGQAVGEPIAGWAERGGVVDDSAILDAWRAIAARLDVGGAVRVDRSREARPRAFVVDPGREVVVVVPAVIDTPASRFAVLHELGHAAAALARPADPEAAPRRVAGTELPRAVDEAVASFVARMAEQPGAMPARWTSELAAPARARRFRIAAALDRAERALPAVAPVGAVPAWGLWHDPGAQAAYVEAEAIADRLQAGLGPSPPRGQFAAVLGRERDRVDRAVRL